MYTKKNQKITRIKRSYEKSNQTIQGLEKSKEQFGSMLDTVRRSIKKYDSLIATHDGTARALEATREPVERDETARILRTLLRNINDARAKKMYYEKKRETALEEETALLWRIADINTRIEALCDRTP